MEERRPRKEFVLHWLSLTCGYIFAAALLAIPIALGDARAMHPTVGEPPAWWERAAELFVWWLPWVTGVGALFLAPAVIQVRSRAGFAGTLLVAIVLSGLPALLFALLGTVVPGAAVLVTLAFPVGMLGAAVALVGTALWLAAQRGCRIFRQQPPPRRPRRPAPSNF